MSETVDCPGLRHPTASSGRPVARPRILGLLLLASASVLACKSERSSEDSSREVALRQQIATGQNLYRTHCGNCHQPNGRGLPGSYPSLVESKVVAQGAEPIIRAILHGIGKPPAPGAPSDKIVMPKQSHLKDEEIADIVTFVLNTFGNQPGPVQPSAVAALRASAP